MYLYSQEAKKMERIMLSVTDFIGQNWLGSFYNCFRCLDIQTWRISYKPVSQKNDSICPAEICRRARPHLWLLIGNKSYNKEPATFPQSFFLLRLRSERSSQRFWCFGNDDNNHNNKKTLKCINMHFLRGFVNAFCMDQVTLLLTTQFFFTPSLFLVF